MPRPRVMLGILGAAVIIALALGVAVHWHRACQYPFPPAWRELADGAVRTKKDWDRWYAVHAQASWQPVDLIDLKGFVMVSVGIDADRYMELLVRLQPPHHERVSLIELVGYTRSFGPYTVRRVLWDASLP